MISGINNLEQSLFQPQFFQRQSSLGETLESSMSFEDEDQAIISSQAKLQNELEKFNAGESNPVDLAVASEISKFTVSAEVNVINTKKDMMDAILDIGR